jgi:hypothetical protein
MRRTYCRPRAKWYKSLLDDHLFILPLIGLKLVGKQELLIVAMEKGSEDDNTSPFLDELAADLMVFGQLLQDGGRGGPEPQALQEYPAREGTVRSALLSFSKGFVLLFRMHRQQSEGSVRR